MSAQVEPGSSPAVESRSFGAGIVGFVETLFGWVVLVLVVVGLVALTLTWRTSDIEFRSNGELLVTNSTWWGMKKHERRYQASATGEWTLEVNGRASDH